MDYCSLLEDRITVVKRLHKERKTYMDLDCDKFDWFNKGKTADKRLERHQDALDNVDAQLKGLYNSRDRFCK